MTPQQHAALTAERDRLKAALAKCERERDYYLEVGKVELDNLRADKAKLVEALRWIANYRNDISSSDCARKALATLTQSPDEQRKESLSSAEADKA